MIHPARRIHYRELIAGLRDMQDAKLVSARRLGDHSLWCYAPKCVFDRAWNEITILARGLILDERRERVVATPFPKFWNLGERGESIPDLPFEVFTKEDGSLIILWHDGNVWRTATKGSLDSDQARAAAAWIGDRDLSALVPGSTYLAEYVAPTNRIVVPYEREELVLLAAYDEGGLEFGYTLLADTADQLAWRLVERHAFDSITDLVEHTERLPATAEGFVLLFADGTRLKIKGDEYKRVHALISRCTPLAMWEAMEAGDNMAAIRDQLPDEFLGDFDTITRMLGEGTGAIIDSVVTAAAEVATWTDKEVGLNLAKWPEPVRSLIFPYRKNGGDLMTGRARRALFRAIRPTANVLLGYAPSYAMNRIAEEALG